MNLCDAIAGPKPHTNEWCDMRLFDPERKERPIVIGASEAYGACTNALQLYLEKRMEIPAWDPDEETQERMDMGLALEPVIIDAYEHRMDCWVERRQPMYFSRLHAFMSATPDGLGKRATSGEIWGVEAKNSNFRMFDDSGEDYDKFGVDGSDQIPVRYLYQAQHQMAVLGLKKIDFPVLRGGNKLQIYHVDRNDEFIAQMVSEEEELSQRIVNGDPPPPNYTSADTRRLLHEMFGCEVGTVVTLGIDLKEEWLRLEELKLQVKEIEEVADEIKNRIMFAMGDAQEAVFHESEIVLKKTVVQDSIVTQDDVIALKVKIGEIKRKGHTRLQRVRK